MYETLVKYKFAGKFLARIIKKKSTERISMNLGKRMGYGPENNPLKFSSDLYKDTEMSF